MDGNTLYGLVERYYDIGTHRAGTDGDRATVDWYGAELTRRGLAVERRAEPFDRYVTTSALTADGVAIDHIPLFYEWTGSITTDEVRVLAADAKAGGRDGDLDHVLDPAQGAVAIATTHPDGSLVAVNREPRPHDGAPTVLIAGRDFATVDAADAVHLDLTAAIEPGTTTNLIARSATTGPPIVLTTPLTGWFGCAGERGTGVAVLLDLVERFAEYPILVLATGGHELDYLGVRRWVASSPEPLRAIVHVGASVAVDAPDPDDGRRRLVPTRLAMTDLAGAPADRVGAALAPASFVFRPDTTGWLGESEVLCDLGVPMISFTGSGIDFHTPEDTPSRATSPAALATVADAIGDAIEAVWEATA
ncbi:MAG: hypothetical protein AAGA90_07575 [Actinomycetota bacterium]